MCEKGNNKLRMDILVQGDGCSMASVVFTIGLFLNLGSILLLLVHFYSKSYLYKDLVVNKAAMKYGQSYECWAAYAC